MNLSRNPDYIVCHTKQLCHFGAAVTCKHNFPCISSLSVFRLFSFHYFASKIRVTWNQCTIISWNIGWLSASLDGPWTQESDGLGTIWKLSWSIFSNFIQARWCSRFAFNHTRSITFCVRSCIYTRKTTNFRLLLWRLFIYYNVILSLWKWWHLRAAHFSAHNLLVNFD